MEEELLGLNNFWKLTKSQKIRRSDYIIDMIAEKIDNNQYIKRFMRYYSTNPLSKKGFINGKTIIQKDLKDSLMKDTQEIESPFIIDNDERGSKKCLFTYGFNDDIVVDEQNYIFIENKKIIYDNVNKMATMYLTISILVPDVYLELRDNDCDYIIRRNKIIANTIENMLGDYTVDDKYSKYIGNIKFELTDYNEDRLSNNSNKILTTLVYKTKYSTVR